MMAGMGDDDRVKWEAAVRDLWAALTTIDPLDRLLLSTVFVVGLAVGIHERLGLLAPFYAVVLAAVGALLFWAIRELARTKSE